MCVCDPLSICRYGEQAGNVTADSLDTGRSVAKLTYVRTKAILYILFYYVGVQLHMSFTNLLMCCSDTLKAVLYNYT